MLKIGDFSALTGMSIYMLRNYDKIGLLQPVNIDETSGYRYYSEEQIPIANQINVLKNLGFRLSEIAGISGEGMNSNMIQEFLEQKILEKQKEVQAASEQLSKLKLALQEISNQEMRSLSVTIKTVPERTVASLRCIINRFQDEGLLWSSLGNICDQFHITEAGFGEGRYSYAITHRLELEHGTVCKEGYKVKEIDVEVQRHIEGLPSISIQNKAVEKCFKDTKGEAALEFKRIPAITCAALAFMGNYEQLGEINAYMAKWIHNNGYKSSGISFVTYFRSPGNETNPSQFITEVCFPVNAVKK